MKLNQLLKGCAILFSFCGLSLLFYWLAFVNFLPVSELESDMTALILSNNWVVVHVFEALAYFAGLMGIMLFFSIFSSFMNRLHTVAVIFISAAFLSFAALALIKVIIWPIFAESVPSYFDIKSGLMLNSRAYKIFSFVSAATFILGHIFFMLFTKRISSLGSILIIPGAVLMNLGFILGPANYILRMIGALLYAGAAVIISARLMSYKVYEKFFHKINQDNGVKNERHENQGVI